MTAMGKEQQNLNMVLQKFTREIIDKRVAENDDKPAQLQVYRQFVLFKKHLKYLLISLKVNNCVELVICL